MNKFRAFARTIRGPLVPLLAAFDDQERLDLASTCRYVDWLIAHGHKLFWTTYGTTHYMALKDSEVLELTEALAKVIAGRGIFIASVPRQWATNQCIEFVHFAARCGVHAVKLQLDWNFLPNDDQVIECYSRIAAVSPVPLLAYTLGPSGITASLLRRIIAIPQFIGMKNDSDNFYGNEHYLRTVRQHSDPEEFLIITGGGLSSVALCFDLGVKAYGDTTSLYAPALSHRLYESFRSGNRALVNKFLAEVEEQLFFDIWPQIAPMGGVWSWVHAIAYHLGLFASPKMRFPMRDMTPKQIEDAKKFLEFIAAWEQAQDGGANIRHGT